MGQEAGNKGKACGGMVVEWGRGGNKGAVFALQLALRNSYSSVSDGTLTTKHMHQYTVSASLGWSCQSGCLTSSAQLATCCSLHHAI